MLRKKVGQLGLGLLLSAGFAQAQFGLQTVHLQDRIWGQNQQPANIMEGDFNSVRIGVQGGFWMGNTHSHLKGIFSDGGYITEATKDDLISQLKANEDLGAGLHLGYANVNFKLGEQRLGVSIDEYNTGYFRFNSPTTLGLILKGNGPYAGDTLSDQGMQASLAHVRELGLATGFDFDGLSLGVKLRLKQGIRMLDLSDASYQLYTSPLGTQIQLDAQYDLYSSQKLLDVKAFDFQGFGASLDLGMRYELNENMVLDAAILDLGGISWKSYHLSEQVNVDWEGVSVSNLFAEGLSDTISAQVDSVMKQILPDSVAGNHFVLSPTIIRAGFAYQLSERGKLTSSLVYAPFRGGQRTRLPLISVGYQHELIDGLVLGANAQALGLDTFGFGAFATYRLSFGDNSLDALIGSDNLLGFLAPGIGRGMSAFAGIGLNF